MRQLCEDVWLVQEAFRFLYLFEIGANSLVIRLPRAAPPSSSPPSPPPASHFLLLLNPPPMTPAALAELRAVEAAAGGGARIEVLLSPGDWHHLSLPAAAAAFPEAALYCFERCVRRQPALRGRATVLDARAPRVPELGDAVALEALAGFSMDGMPWLLSGEPRGAPRLELAVLHRASATLFLNDVLFAPAQAGALPACNTGGFFVADAAAAAASLARVAALGAARAVFAHRALPLCVLEPDGGAAALAALLAEAAKGFVSR
jgi:hypothetical protein